VLRRRPFTGRGDLCRNRSRLKKQGSPSFSQGKTPGVLRAYSCMTPGPEACWIQQHRLAIGSVRKRCRVGKAKPRVGLFANARNLKNSSDRFCKWFSIEW